MSNIGISPYGLCDRVAVSNLGCFPENIGANDFKPNVIILPYSTVKTDVLSGSKAKYVRVGVGLSRPFDAVVENIGDRMSRVLIASLWDRMIYEKSLRDLAIHSLNGQAYSVSSLLAHHIKTLTSEVLTHHVHLENEKHTICVPIPSHLNSFQQEFLLRALASGGLKNTSYRLLWRSVAVAMRWLDKISLTEQIAFIGKSILTLYLGPDSIELDCLKIDQTKNELASRLIPCRTKVSDSLLFKYTGLDLAVGVAEYQRSRLNRKYTSYNEILKQQWQIINQCPDIWASLSGYEFSFDETLVELDDWKIWQETDYKKFLSNNKIILSGLRNHLKNIERYDRNFENDLFSDLKSNISKFAQKCEDEVVAVIVFGPMSSSYIAHNLCLNQFSSVNDTPKSYSVWYSSAENLALACADYLDKKDRNEETYYDFLPRLNALYLDELNQKYAWVALINNKDKVADGDVFINETDYLFAIKKGAPKLEFFLDMPEDDDNSEPIPGEEYNYQFRRLESVVSNDLPIKLKTTMSPASGLAKVYVISRNDEFMPIAFDYSSMSKKQLGKISLLYPKCEKLDNGSVGVNHGDWKENPIWREIIRLAKGESSLSAHCYLDEQHDNKNSAWRADISHLNFNKNIRGEDIRTGNYHYYRFVNYEGESFSKESDLLIDLCIQRIEKDYVKNRIKFENLINKDVVFRRLACFYSKTPKFVKNYFLRQLLAANEGNTSIHVHNFDAIAKFIGSEGKKEQKLFFRYFDYLPKLNQNHVRIIYNLFFHDVRVTDNLEKHRADRMLAYAADMVNNRIVNTHVIDKSGKISFTTVKRRFRTACLAVYCALIYRRVDSNYLRINDTTSSWRYTTDSAKLNDFYHGIDNLIKDAARFKTLKPMIKIFNKNKEDIVNFVNCKGSQDIISSLLSADNDDEDND